MRIGSQAPTRTHSDPGADPSPTTTAEAGTPWQGMRLSLCERHPARGSEGFARHYLFGHQRDQHAQAALRPLLAQADTQARTELLQALERYLDGAPAPRLQTLASGRHGDTAAAPPPALAQLLATHTDRADGAPHIAYARLQDQLQGLEEALASAPEALDADQRQILRGLLSPTGQLQHELQTNFELLRKAFEVEQGHQFLQILRQRDQEQAQRAQRMQPAETARRHQQTEQQRREQAQLAKAQALQNIQARLAALARSDAAGAPAAIAELERQWAALEAGDAPTLAAPKASLADATGPEALAQIHRRNLERLAQLRARVP